MSGMDPRLAAKCPDGWALFPGSSTWHRVEQGKVLCGVASGYAVLHEAGTGEKLKKCSVCEGMVTDRA